MSQRDQPVRNKRESKSDAPSSGAKMLNRQRRESQEDGSSSSQSGIYAGDTLHYALLPRQTVLAHVAANRGGSSHCTHTDYTLLQAPRHADGAQHVNLGFLKARPEDPELTRRERAAALRRERAKAMAKFDSKIAECDDITGAAWAERESPTPTGGGGAAARAARLKHLSDTGTKPDPRSPLDTWQSRKEKADAEHKLQHDHGCARAERREAAEHESRRAQRAEKAAAAYRKDLARLKRAEKLEQMQFTEWSDVARRQHEAGDRHEMEAETVRLRQHDAEDEARARRKAADDAAEADDLMQLAERSEAARRRGVEDDRRRKEIETVRLHHQGAEDAATARRKAADDAAKADELRRSSAELLKAERLIADEADRVDSERRLQAELDVAHRDVLSRWEGTPAKRTHQLLDDPFEAHDRDLKHVTHAGQESPTMTQPPPGRCDERVGYSTSLAYEREQRQLGSAIDEGQAQFGSEAAMEELRGGLDDIRAAQAPTPTPTAPATPPVVPGSAAAGGGRPRSLAGGFPAHGDLDRDSPSRSARCAGGEGPAAAAASPTTPPPPTPQDLGPDDIVLPAGGVDCVYRMVGRDFVYVRPAEVSGPHASLYTRPAPRDVGGSTRAAMQTRGATAEPGTVNAQMNELSPAEQMAITMAKTLALNQMQHNDSYSASVARDLLACEKSQWVMPSEGHLRMLLLRNAGGQWTLKTELESTGQEYAVITVASRAEHMDTVAAAIGDSASQGNIFRTPIHLTQDIIAAAELASFGVEGLTPDMFNTVTDQSLHGNGLRIASPGAPWKVKQPSKKHTSKACFLKGLRLLSDYVSVRMCAGLGAALRKFCEELSNVTDRYDHLPLQDLRDLVEFVLGELNKGITAGVKRVKASVEKANTAANVLSAGLVSAQDFSEACTTLGPGVLPVHGSAESVVGDLVGETIYMFPLCCDQMNLRKDQYQHHDFDGLYACSRFMCAYFQKEKARSDAYTLRMSSNEASRAAEAQTRHGSGAPPLGAQPAAASASPGRITVGPGAPAPGQRVGRPSKQYQRVILTRVKGFDADAAKAAFASFPGSENGIKACVAEQCHDGCQFGSMCRFRHGGHTAVLATKAEFKKLGAATAAICAANGGHLSGPRIPSGEREAASARAWVAHSSSTRSGGSSAATPLSCNPVPVEIAAVVAKFPHPLQSPLQDLITNDPSKNPLAPLDEPLNPAKWRFDPATLREYEVIGSAEKFREEYQFSLLVIPQIERAFRAFGVWRPAEASGSTRALEHESTRDFRVIPWLASHVEFHSRGARPVDS